MADHKLPCTGLHDPPIRTRPGKDGKDRSEVDSGDLYFGDVAFVET